MRFTKSVNKRVNITNKTHSLSFVLFKLIGRAAAGFCSERADLPRPLARRGRELGCLALAFVALLSAVGCGRSESANRVALQFPDWDQLREMDFQRQGRVSTQSVEPGKIHMIAVNVSSSDLKTPFVFLWERQSEEDTPPAEVSFDIPRGKDRLFQALAVYEGDSGLAFYYGDTTAAIAINTQSVSLVLTNALAASQTREGRIIGRYLGSDGTGPTGEFQYRFIPPGDKPSMVVTQGEVFAGWLQLVALNVPQIAYTKIDGSPLFPEIADARGSIHTGGGSALYVSGEAARTRSMAIKIPRGYRESHGENGSIEWRAEPERRIAFGFFGPGASGKKACYAQPSTYPEIPGFRVDGNSDAAMIKWAGAGTDAAGLVVVLPTDSVGGQSQSGGDSTATCQDNQTQFKDWIYFNYDRLANSDGLAGFQGPYVLNESQDSNGPNALSANYDSSRNEMEVKWITLPGVAEDLGGFTLFYQAVSEKGHELIEGLRKPTTDGYRCDELAASQKFSRANINSPTVVEDIGDSWKITLTLTSQDLSGEVVFLACPRVKGSDKYFTSAAAGVW